MTIDACLDEEALTTAWNGVDAWKTRVSDLLDLIENVLRVDDVVVHVTSDVSSSRFGGALSLDEIRAQNEASTRDEMRRLDIALSQCRSFDAGAGTADEVLESISIGHGAVRCTRFQVSALLTLGARHFKNMPSGWRSPNHVCVENDEGWRNFLRSWMGIVHPDTRRFLAVAEYAYPALYFHGELNLNDFRLHPTEYWPELVRHLAFLNDIFNSLAVEVNHMPDQIQRYSRAQHSIKLSPESPNTRRNAAAIKTRKITVNGESISCEWHTKFNHEKGRIHFHPGVGQSESLNRVTGGRLVVGIFAFHLAT